MIHRTLCPVLLAAVLPAQQFTPAPTLSGDDIVAASAGNQSRPVVASGGGATLAVWEDDRSSRVDSVFGGQALNSSVPGNIDVFGVLLDGAGRPLITAPIAIAAETWDQTNPRIAWNGSSFLVVFESTRPTAFYRSKGIYGVRVAPSGAVLDAVAFRIDDDPDVDEGFPTVASVGGRWLVTWSDVDAVGATVLRGCFVDGSANVTAATTMVTGPAGLPPTEVAMASSGTRVAMAWSAGWGGGVFAELYDQNGVRVGNRIVLAATTGGKPAIGAAVHGFYVAWQDGGFRGTPVDANGVIAVPGGSLLAPIGATSAPALAVAFDGVDWVVAYPSPPSVFAVRVATSGVVAATVAVATSPISLPLTIQHIAAVGGSGSTTLLWTDWRLGLDSSDSADVFSASITVGAIGAAAPISVSMPAQVNVRIAGASPLGHLLVYESQTSGTTRIMTRLVDAAGVPVLPQPFEIAMGDRSIGGPAVAWNGSEYLVTWGRLQSTASNGPPPLIEARRCDLLGAPIDPAPFTVMEGGGVAVAAVGPTFLVAGLYRHLTLQFTPVMRCRRIDGPTGAMLDATPRTILLGAGGGVRMVAFADRWLVAFGTMQGAFVLADGTPQPPFFAGTMGSVLAPHLDLCLSADGSGALLSFEHKRASQVHADVHVRRLAADGSSPDPVDGVPVSAHVQSELRPMTAALDDGFVCLWADHRDSQEGEPGLGDVFAARVPFSGSPLDPTGLAVHDTPAAEGGVAAMRSGRGTALVAASVLAPAFGAHRLALSIYRSPSTTPWSAIGNGLAGSGGVPQLAGFGTLIAGAPFDLTLSAARPNSLAVTGLGVAIAGLPLLGGVLVPQPLIIVDSITDGSGRLMLGTTFPPGLSGVNLYAQTWIVDAAAVQGVAATAGLRGIAP